MKRYARRTAFGLALLVLAPFVSGCRGGESYNPAAPTAVSNPVTTPDVIVRAVDIDRVPAGAPVPVILPPTGDRIGATDVSFPPRNETYDFRRSLEDLYRTELGRAPTSTFVDLEGAVVWVQEYLRYRVNTCSHADSIARVMNQIDGRGISPVCGSTTSLAFPPRNESLDFMQQLEAKYQNGLRRSSTGTFVDVIGNVVWTQEYLRYRAEDCSSQEAVQKIRTQINGGGVPPGCRAGTGIIGYWDGTYADGTAFTMQFEGADGAQPRGTADGIFLRVQSLGNTFTFTANYFNLDGEWIASWDGADTMRGTARGSLTHPGPFTARRRR